MKTKEAETNLLKLVEPLAAIEHERWAHWQTYLHSQCLKNHDGSLTIPSELVERWERQANTPYHKLSDKEKDSDKEQVMNYLNFIIRESSL
ncbi:hypothetical protein ABNM12_11455 [Pseudomonas syringae]|uniref:hypothetical protein n=1 Tax=Pseudomonas TaxID=286 RepID=UPI0007602FC9|nr:hypothetical protein [Pseudomonas syringae]KWS23667.1 hypothetical protein AL061_21580 [Pseudomonas syringae pv. syringae]RXT81759.1 hypothetical protein B1F69_28885 [Pseudomonas syringae]